jgi:hypothetical protein
VQTALLALHLQLPDLVDFRVQLVLTDLTV